MRKNDWNGYGWDDPAPQLPGLEVFPDSCTVEEFAQKVSGQHVSLGYGDFVEELRDFWQLMDIEVLQDKKEERENGTTGLRSI